jgi:hypothetical protein
MGQKETVKMSSRNKTIHKGNSSQSGREVHGKTHGHVASVVKSMGLDAKLPTHQSQKPDRRGTLVEGKTATKER